MSEIPDEDHWEENQDQFQNLWLVFVGVVPF